MSDGAWPPPCPKESRTILNQNILLLEESDETHPLPRQFLGGSSCRKPGEPGFIHSPELLCCVPPASVTVILHHTPHLAASLPCLHFRGQVETEGGLDGMRASFFSLHLQPAEGAIKLTFI